MHTLVSKLVALSVEKYYVALTEIRLKICRFHGSLSQRGSRPLNRLCSYLWLTRRFTHEPALPEFRWSLQHL